MYEDGEVEVNNIRLAKLIAPFLEVRAARTPVTKETVSFRLGYSISEGIKSLRKKLEYHFASDEVREAVDAEKRHDEMYRQRVEEFIAGHDQELAEAGIETEAEMNAFLIVNFSDMHMSRLIHHAADLNAYDLEIIEAEQEIRTDEENFEKILAACLDDGIYSLEDHFSISGVRCQVFRVNSDFREKALRVYLEEAKRILGAGKETQLFDRSRITGKNDNVHISAA